jgi:hypothetical protein
VTPRTIDVEFEFHAPRRQRDRDDAGPPVPHGSVPRLSRLMALAIKCNDMVARGEISDFAELARIGHVTRARMSQIMNLVNLAPEIQEEILFLPRTERGRDPIKETDIRRIACEPRWKMQRARWRELRSARIDVTDCIPKAS